MIGLGEFYTVLDDLCSLTVEDGAVLGYGDLVYCFGFRDCHLYCSYESPSASSEADKLSGDI